MTFAGQKVLIIGGTSGFGFATAVAAANDGAEVVVASSKQKSVDGALARLPNTARGLAINLANESDVEAFFDRLGQSIISFSLLVTGFP
jgi:NAD(P)-dependent dehydrogenase (short-subunit alcohol dehydrogenase family)